MKLGAISTVFAERPFREAARHMNEMGLEAIELGSGGVRDLSSLVGRIRPPNQGLYYPRRALTSRSRDCRPRTAAASGQMRAGREAGGDAPYYAVGPGRKSCRRSGAELDTLALPAPVDGHL